MGGVHQKPTFPICVTFSRPVFSYISADSSFGRCFVLSPPRFPIYQRTLLWGGGGHGSCFCSHPHPFFPICHTFPFFLTTGICFGRCFFSHPPISPPHARFVPIYNISPYIYRYHPIHNHPIYISPASPHIYIYIYHPIHNRPIYMYITGILFLGTSRISPRSKGSR